MKLHQTAIAPLIERHPAAAPPGARYSVVLPTWNNLPFLRLCLESLRKNSAHPHEVVVHVNDGSDGTLDWVRASGIAHTASATNAGVCWGMNAAAALAGTEYLVYMNDDMYACPGWDAPLLRAAAELDHRRFFLSATAIEPTGTNPSCYAPHDFGRRPDELREAELLAALPSFSRADWSGASSPPCLVPRELWDLVGGYSVEYSPGYSSDYDFSMKLWRAGVREFRGVGASMVYHFGKVSTSRIRSDDGRALFARKWGVPASWFYRSALRMAAPYQGPLPEMESLPSYRWAVLKARRYRLWPW